MSKSIVSIIKTAADSPDFLSTARQAFQNIGDFASIVQPGMTVLLKPNVFAPQPAPATTDPRLVAAVVRLCRDAGARRVIVGEGRSISTAKYRPKDNTTRACFEVTSIARAAQENGAELLAFEEDEVCEVPLPQGELLKTAHVPATLLQADVFINLPALKIHSLTLVTLAIKNLHGIVSDADKLFSHSYFDACLARKLVDISTIRKPDLNLICGHQGLEADHALPTGRPLDMGILIAGTDIVAVDAVASAAMGLDPMEVDTTRIASERGLGAGRLEEIEIRGEPLAAIRKTFARPETQINQERFPGLRVIAGDYCRSCEYYICRGLQNLQAMGLLSQERPLTLILGKDPDITSVPEGKIILVGDCCLSSESVKSLRNDLLLEGRLSYIWACPPMEFRLRAAELLG